MEKNKKRKIDIAPGMLKIKKPFGGNKDLLIIFIICAIYFMQQLISFRFGMNFEEYRDANAYLLSMQGYLPYRDFEWIFGPFSFFIYPFIMKIFGVKLIVLRISYILFVSWVIPLSYFLAKRILSYFWAGIAAFLSIIFFVLPYYTFNHVFAVIGELVCLLMICRFIESNRKNSNIFWAGIFACVTLLTKPLLPGLSLLFAVSLFLLLAVDSGQLIKRIKNIFIFILGTIILIIVYLLYFYFQTAFRNMTVVHPSFLAKDSLNIIDHASRINLSVFSLLIKRLTDLLPIHRIINISSFTELKNILVATFDAFIFFLPFINAALISFIYIASKLDRFRPDIKKKILSDSKFLLLFVIFSIFISLESVIITHSYGKAYNTQVSLIMLVYILYIIRTFCSYRIVISKVLIALFIFCVIFLPFFRFPYSKFKKYTAPLNIERTRGIFVTSQEKQLYESLSSYLLANFKKEDKMAVMGYFPQFSFLTERKNIFEDDEGLFLKLDTLLAKSAKNEKIKSFLAGFENKIISKIKEKKPKVVLIVTYISFADPKKEINSLSSITVKDYIEKNYYLDKIFGPADIFGSGGFTGWVKLYKLKT